jgi:hypothetical protein
VHVRRLATEVPGGAEDSRLIADRVRLHVLERVGETDEGILTEIDWKVLDYYELER